MPMQQPSPLFQDAALKRQRLYPHRLSTMGRAAHLLGTTGPARAGGRYGSGGAGESYSRSTDRWDAGRDARGRL